MARSRSQDEVRRRYRWRARTYDLICRPLYAGVRRAATARILAFLREGGVAQPTVLELGCGTGLNLRALHRELPTARLVGVDLSRAMLRRATPHVASLVQGGTSCLQGEQADVVLLSFVVAVAPEGLALLDEAERLLKPGGLLVMVDSGRFDGGWRWLDPLLGALISWSGQADLDLVWADCEADAIHLGGLARLATTRKRPGA
jgi:ubiquinone/menaquinone biosynthesis C-methylase UbiE